MSDSSNTATDSAGNASTQADAPSTTFQVQDALSAFSQYSDEEYERLEQTDPGFDAQTHQRAQRLVSERLAALAVDGSSGKARNGRSGRGQTSAGADA